MSTSPVLFSAARCPYAQRTRIVMGEKGIEAIHREVDLDAPDEAFLQASPYGKVPLLEHEGHRIWESSVINEYLDERYPAPALMPTDPGLRAWVRDWIDHANSELAPRFYKLLEANDEAAQQAARTALGEAMQFVDSVGLGAECAGDYLVGNTPTLADIAYLPFLERLPAVSTHRDFSWPCGCDRLHNWQQRMSARPAVAATLLPPPFHIDNYARYARGEADLSKSLSTRDL